MPKLLLLLCALTGLSKAAVGQVDTVPPYIKCKTQLDVTLPGYNCLTSFMLSDFVDTVSDNVTPVSNLSITGRKPCTGEGYPTEAGGWITYQSEEIGFSTVDIWVKDQAGNTSTCSSTLFLQPHPILCCIYWPTVLVSTPDYKPLPGVSINEYIEPCNGQVSDKIYVTAANATAPPGFAAVEGIGWTKPGNLAIYTPSKNTHPNNGVTGFDLILILKHILGVALLDSPYKIIAADINQDDKVTVTDVVLLRQFILGGATTLPNGKSWRFIPTNFQFSNPQNPFAIPFPEQIIVPRNQDPRTQDQLFIGIKIGDVNFSADPNQ